MEWCPKYQTKVTGCSKQDSVFAPELCERCLEEKITVVNPRKAELVRRWREKLGIEAGMSKEEALSRLGEWRAAKKTCERCEEKDLSEFCPLHLICKEAEEVVENGREIVIGEGPDGHPETQEIGLGFHEVQGAQVGQGL